MIKLKPIQTEKSLKLAENGKYTFQVPTNLAKPQIKNLINKVFDVNVVTIKTMRSKKRTKRNLRGKAVTIKAVKKAIVTLRDKESIDIFGEKASKAKSASGGRRKSK